MGVIEGPRVKAAADELNAFLDKHWPQIEEYNAFAWGLKKAFHLEQSMSRKEYEEGRMHYYKEYNTGNYDNGLGMLQKYDRLRGALEYEKLLVARAKKFNPLETDPSKPSEFMTFLDDKLLDPAACFTLEDKIKAIERRDKFDQEMKRMTQLREEVKKQTERRKRQMSRGR